MKNVAVASYGCYVPYYRLKVEDIAAVWGKNPRDIKKSLAIAEKSVSAPDEDSVTLGFEASSQALKLSKLKPSQLGAVLTGSESHPYAVNPTSTILGEFLNIGKNYFASDMEFACKGATAALLSVAGLVSSGRIEYGMIVGTDCAQSKPHDVLEYSAASAAAAFIIGPPNSSSLATLEASVSVSSDTPDFWRRDGVRFPSHTGRFTGEPAYFYHVGLAARQLLEKTSSRPSDYQYCIFHMPNGKFPRVIARRLGFTARQLAPSLIVDKIGNPYSASSLLGLASVLSKAKPGDRIFFVSYGSGAGSDGLTFRVRRTGPRFDIGALEKKYVSYIDYLKFTKKI